MAFADTEDTETGGGSQAEEGWHGSDYNGSGVGDDDDDYHFGNNNANVNVPLLAQLSAIAESEREFGESPRPRYRTSDFASSRRACGERCAVIHHLCTS